MSTRRLVIQRSLELIFCIASAGLGAMIVYALVSGWFFLWHASPFAIPWRAFAWNCAIFVILFAGSLFALDAFGDGEDP